MCSYLLGSYSLEVSREVYDDPCDSKEFKVLMDCLGRRDSGHGLLKSLTHFPRTPLKSMVICSSHTKSSMLCLGNQFWFWGTQSLRIPTVYPGNLEGKYLKFHSKTPSFPRFVFFGRTKNSHRFPHPNGHNWRDVHQLSQRNSIKSSLKKHHKTKSKCWLRCPFNASKASCCWLPGSSCRTRTCAPRRRWHVGKPMGKSSVPQRCSKPVFKTGGPS